MGQRHIRSGLMVPLQPGQRADMQVKRQVIRRFRLLGLLLVPANLVYHIFWILFTHVVDPWMIFRPWYFVLVCLVPPAVTLTITSVAGLVRGRVVHGSLFAILASIGLAYLHDLLIDAAAASV